MRPDPIRVLVVDDQDLVRGGFKAILGTYEAIEIVGEAETGPMRYREAQRPSARRGTHGHPHA